MLAAVVAAAWAYGGTAVTFVYANWWWLEPLGWGALAILMNIFG